MSERYSREQQACSLCLDFFPSSSNQTSLPTKKWVVSLQVTKAPDTTRRNGRSNIAGDC